jgi:hypothetical protein
MKTIITIAIFTLTLASAGFAQNMKKDAAPCEMIKGKTFIAWSAGKFDDNPDAAAAMRIVFDARGKGTARTFIAFRPTDATGTQQIQTVTCAVLPASPSNPATSGKSYLQFVTSAGSDAGKAFITSYDNGSKIWAEAASPGRPMKGWMLQLPPNPPAADNIIK